MYGKLLIPTTTVRDPRLGLQVGFSVDLDGVRVRRWKSISPTKNGQWKRWLMRRRELESDAIYQRAAFVIESNKIEGIARPPTKEELDEFERFLALDRVEVSDLEAFVRVYQPDAMLRRTSWQNVQVGSHVAPPGGPEIERELSDLLRWACGNGISPYDAHVRYETLHPFTDGNGRSGRALWAWQMGRFNYWPGLKLGFLHCFYYQTLEASVR